MRVTVPTAENMTQKPVPKGTYSAVFSKITAKPSQSSGNMVLWTTWQITSPGSDPDITTIGKKVTDNFTTTEDAMFRINNAVKAITGADMQFQGESPELDEFVAYLTQVFSQGEVNIQVDIDTYQGQARNKIQGYIPKAS
jgi:hypothetical protein